MHLVKGARCGSAPCVVLPTHRVAQPRRVAMVLDGHFLLRRVERLDGHGDEVDVVAAAPQPLDLCGTCRTESAVRLVEGKVHGVGVHHECTMCGAWLSTRSAHSASYCRLKCTESCRR